MGTHIDHLCAGYFGQILFRVPVHDVIAIRSG